MRKLVIRTTACCVLSTCLVTGGAVISNADNTEADLPAVGIADVLGDYCATDSTKLPSAGVSLTLDEYAVTSADTELLNSVSKVSEEYRTLVIAQVDGYVNVRAEAKEDAEVVGKLYNNTAATILAKQGDWYKITSGNVIGYVKSDYVVEGEEAQLVGESVYERNATAEEALNVYAAMDSASDVLYTVEPGETMKVLEELGEYTRVSYAVGEGYVISGSITVATAFTSAETLEEEAARIAAEEAAAKALAEAQAAKEAAEAAAAEEAAKAAQEAAEAAAKAAEEAEAEAAAQAAAEAQEAAEAAAAAAQEAAEREEQQASQSASEDSYSEDSYSDSSSASESETSESYNSAESYSDSSKGQQIANYALQFVGNPYQWGGTSLTNGADCSGFVLSVMSDCGISVAGRTAAAQSTGGTSISASELQPGDLVFYASGGSVSHVAIYIGDGQIVHAANSRKGIIVSTYNYQTPYKYVRYY